MLSRTTSLKWGRGNLDSTLCAGSPVTQRRSSTAQSVCQNRSSTGFTSLELPAAASLSRGRRQPTQSCRCRPRPKAVGYKEFCGWYWVNSSDHPSEYQGILRDTHAHGMPMSCASETTLGPSRSLIRGCSPPQRQMAAVPEPVWQLQEPNTRSFLKFAE